MIYRAMKWDDDLGIWRILHMGDSRYRANELLYYFKNVVYKDTEITIAIWDETQYQNALREYKARPNFGEGQYGS